MTDYTAEEVDAALNEEDGWEAFDYSEHTGATRSYSLRGEAVEFELQDGKYSTEGGGEDIWLVVRAGDQYFRKAGWYASHDGAYWDGDCREVKPVQRMTTFWE